MSGILQFFNKKCHAFRRESKKRVKICKQCVQTASVLPGLRPWTPMADFHPQTPWAVAPKLKFPTTLLCIGQL